MIELEAVELFRGLNRKEQDDLRAIALVKPYASGSQIFREGDRGDGLYVVSRGSVQIAHVIDLEVRHVFSVFGPGECFGEMAVIEDRPRSATALAATAAELYFFPRERMLKLLQNSPGLALNMLHMVSHRLREFNQRHLRELVQSESLAVIGRFAQGIVHDLKNPLSIIGLSSETFSLPGIAPEMSARAQARIKRQVQRINDLVNDILIFTEGRNKGCPTTSADYRAYILELLPDLNTEAELRSACVEIQGNLPAVQIQLDPRRLGRVFHNLVHNATDAMLNGGKIFLRFQASASEMVTEIEDTGPGIAPEIGDNLFQPFMTHGKSQGTGLGLFICKKIIEDHRGKISARREAGRGAIFCFTLPLAH